jgi:outer membrane protein OmpA-like peptidoglycan-associated protein
VSSNQGSGPDAANELTNRVDHAPDLVVDDITVIDDVPEAAPVPQHPALPDDVTWSRRGLVDESKRGKKPRGAGWWLKVLALPVLLLLAAGVWFNVTRIQDDVELASEQILTNAGVDTSTLTFDASFRNVEVGGTLPVGVSAARIEAILESEEGPNGEDIRDATVVATALVGPIDVLATSDGSMIVLNGEVPRPDHLDVLLAAAARADVPVTNNIEVSGRDPEVDDADTQIAALAALLPHLGADVTEARLVLGNTSLDGSIEAINPATREEIAAVAPPGVEVSSLGELQASVTYNGTVLVLDGDVLSESQAHSLVAGASRGIGAENVVNNLTILNAGEAIEGADGKVDAVGELLGSFDNFNSADARFTDAQLTINGEAFDPDALTPIEEALAAVEAAGLQTGGDITLGFELTLEEEIDLLQAELDALQDEIRENVRFDSNSNELTALAGSTLDQVVDAMNRFTRPVVEVGGHTDSQGTEQFNRALSSIRASAVVSYITDQGISSDRLNPVGYGESQPRADNINEEGRQENRRVEFTARESF